MANGSNAYTFITLVIFNLIIYIFFLRQSYMTNFSVLTNDKYHTYIWKLIPDVIIKPVQLRIRKKAQFAPMVQQTSKATSTR